MALPSISPLDGALLVDKPATWTSHDVVAKVRNHFRLQKVGHCGTLDPMATGLLILLLGKATRYSERFMSSDKVYDGVMRLGESTDSYDADGELTDSMPVPLLSVAELNETSKAFTGDLLQTPPMVSAVKIGGTPLYKLARKGLVVAREARPVHVYAYQFDDYEEPFAYFRVSCTKGTYIRSLAHDLGQKLGCGAHLTKLRRVTSGRFDLADGFSLSEILQWDEAELEKKIIPFLKLKSFE
ncbi:MAG: tRNA pseudouridine(55) synthase TruB [Pedosphaera sp.]|nr:tRNA pseudouridine(55) synthase TruB [Pedosphaera sp.]